MRSRYGLQWPGLSFSRMTSCAGPILVPVLVAACDRRLRGYPIKVDPDLKPIPIVAVSSLAMKGYEEKARAAGCDHYVTKPYSPMQLLRLIRGFLGDKP